ncbi:uncharacterized protein LOC112468154, partial [Temnothorax curvispinosus]|uniref:Uncharacterized protein LOC112468154 n=1 Tax=Temnothorax curvispinosus TaxID=300111 RepID=A0A6J1RDU9_9HYME
MAESEKNTDAEMSQEAVKEDLLDLWIYLKNAFDLNGVHKGEIVTLSIEDESLIINTELGAKYRSEKRMLSDKLWNSLLIWREDKLLNDLPLEMPRTPSECHLATEEARAEMAIVENSEERDKDGVDGEIGELGKGKMESLLAKMATVAEVAKERKILPIVVSNEIVSDPKTRDYLNRIKDTKPDPSVSKKTIQENLEINETSAMTKVKIQETKISEMTKAISNFCITTTKTMEQFGASLLQLNQLIATQENVLAESQREGTIIVETTEKLYELIKSMREEWSTQIIRLNNVVDKLITTYNIVDMEEEGEYETNDKNKQTENVATGDNESLESKISSAVKQQLESLRREDLTHMPQIQSIEFVTKNSNGASLSYDQLKLLVMQDEAARNQVRGGLNEVRSVQGEVCLADNATTVASLETTKRQNAPSLQRISISKEEDTGTIIVAPEVE